MKQGISRYFISLVLGLGALSFFVNQYFHPVENPFGLGSDTYEYWHLSENILQHKQLSYTNLSHYPLFELPFSIRQHYYGEPVFSTVRMPGYPFILALARYLWDSPWINLILIYLCYIGICLYGFFIGQFFLTGRYTRWFYNGLLVLSPVYLTRWGVGTDFPASLCLTGFAFHFLSLFKNPDSFKKHMIPLLLWAVATVFIRVNLVIFITVGLLAIWMKGSWRGQKQLLLTGCLLALFLSFSMGAWMWRNYHLTGKWLLTTQSGYVLYTVHLSYDLSAEDPLFYWHQQGKEDFFRHQIASGKSFNRIEAELGEKLKQVVWHVYHQDPWRLIVKWIDGLRTLMMFSYYDISQLIIHSQCPPSERFSLTYHREKQNLEKILFQISRGYKIWLSLSFFGNIGLLMHPHLRRQIPNLRLFFTLYTASLLSLITTAFFTGAGGDRIRMPFNVFLLLCAVIFWQTIKQAMHRKRT